MNQRLSFGAWAGGLCLGAVACGAPATSAPAPSAAAPGTRVTAIADEVFAGFLERFPEQATVFGIAHVPQDRLTDLSPAARQAWQVREDGWLARLQAIDTARIAGGWPVLDLAWPGP